MHYMGPALSSLDYVMDLSTTSVGTDAVFIRFNPHALMQQYIVRPRRVARTYVHMLLHCLFLHMYGVKEHRDHDLWDLCCDIAVESMIDDMGVDAISDIVSDRRSAIYEDLRAQVGVLTADRLYRHFLDGQRDYVREDMLAREFALDDHDFWRRMEENQDDADPENPDMQPPAPEMGAPHGDSDEDEGQPVEENRVIPRGGDGREDEWRERARRMETELAAYGKEGSLERGSLERMLRFTLRTQTNYRVFLRRFMVVREEPRIDMDSFDYGFYNYGMDLYGNMPLIEENEYREANKVEELVIAIDTSASCQDGLVQEFLNDTASILLSGENFFHKVNIHIVECDDQVQQDIVIHDPEEMRRYAQGVSLRGGYGTDFRPVFRYVEELRRTGALPHLRGLLYFTDGFGTYPKEPTDYDTAFVFRRDAECNDRDVPDWALRLYL